MPSLAETQIVSVLAKHLYTFLPGSGAKYTFAEAADDAGVADLWPGVGRQSKLPAITELLKGVLSYRRNKFCDLVEQVVRGGIEYRLRKGAPITRAEVEELNRILLGLHFKIPALWDPRFLESLPGGVEEPEPRAQEVSAPAPIREAGVDPHQLRVLKDGFLELSRSSNRQAAGLQLEQLLTRLFGLFGLAAEASFRVQGEQIDGSFSLDAELYLVEVKWTREPIQPAELYTFTGKVEGKSHFTRGVFMSVNGFSPDAVPALVRGKTPRIILIDGAHLLRVLDGHVESPSLVRRLVRRLATRGEPYWSIAEMMREWPVM